jgi:histidinol phosphatase-like enzyme
MRQIIFLDIDGVLATPETLDKADMWTFTPQCVKQLRRILIAHPSMVSILNEDQ